MYIMCVYLFSALSRRVCALQISIIIIINSFFPNGHREIIPEYSKTSYMTINFKSSA